MLDLLGLKDYGDELAANLPYGDQRKVELSRALATSPLLLLLDESAAGMNPHEADEIIRIIFRIHRERRLTILLVEHDMKVIMGICQRIQVLHRGELIAVGTPQEIQRNPQVIEVYLERPGRQQVLELQDVLVYIGQTYVAQRNQFDRPRKERSWPSSVPTEQERPPPSPPLQVSSIHAGGRILYRTEHQPNLEDFLSDLTHLACLLTLSLLTWIIHGRLVKLGALPPNPRNILMWSIWSVSSVSSILVIRLLGHSVF